MARLWQRARQIDMPTLPRNKESATPASTAKVKASLGVDERFDWHRVVKTFLLSRALDDLEETKLLLEKRVLYQFSARGHELAQILLATLLTEKRDAVSGYYRSRPLLLTLGLTIIDALK